MLAYFDTNVFGHVLERQHGITAEDEVRVRTAIGAGSLTVLTGIHTIDEAAAHPRDPLPQLRLIWELCDWDRIVKPAAYLLRDDIRHFAFNGEADSPLIEPSHRAGLRAEMKLVLADPAKVEELRVLTRNAYPQKKNFRKKIQELRKETRPQLQSARDGQQVQFIEYFEKHSPLVAVQLAEYVGLKENCEGRPADELLKIRSVRMAVGIELSYIWANNVEAWKVKPSDGVDQQHAIAAAAAADIFVTHDSPLAELIRRVPLKGLRVMTLNQLLENVPS